jgi:hypothetical protein
MTELIDVPALGERIVYSWPVSVAERLNRSYILEVAADESTNSGSGSASDVTGLTFPVVNGESYRIEGVLDYSCSATNQGIGFGMRHPGGTSHGIFRVYGVSAAATSATERLIETVANTDEMTTAATVSNAGSHFVLEFLVFYACTADGTFAFRKQRNGTSGSTGVTIYKASGATVYLPA